MKHELWKDVPGYPNYQASSLGRIRTLLVRKPKLLQGTGYLAVGIGDKTVHVHALVAAAFHGPRPADKHINHKNSNRADARPENLEYVTPSENVRHALLASHRLRFSAAQIRKIENLYYVEGLSVLEIARRMSCHRNSIRCAIATWTTARGRKNKHRHKITPDVRTRIQQLYAGGGLTQKQLGKLFDVDPSAISRITSAARVPNHPTEREEKQETKA